MYRDLTVAVVVPAYNECALVGKVIGTMPGFVDHVIVVDDHSSDNTGEVARDAGDPRVLVRRNDRNLGVGGSIIAGHRVALELGADVSVVMAGDAQMDPDYLAPLLDPIAAEGYGFTKANRFFSPTAFAGMPRHRIVGNVMLSFATKAASGYWHIFDPQNGYTAVRADVLRRLPLDHIARGYSFENDLLIYLNILDVRIKDVGVPAIYGEEVSGIRLRRVVPALSYLLVRGFWRRMIWKYVLWSFSPVAMLFFAGLVLSAFGAGFGVFDIYEAASSVSPTSGTVLLSVAPLLLGAQLLVASLVLDIVESPR